MSAYSKKMSDKKKKQGYNRLFLKISGAIYCKSDQRDDVANLTRLLTPGVPQISVNIFNFSSSMTLLKPKSAIMISASSGGSRNSRFSGFKSVDL